MTYTTADYTAAIWAEIHNQGLLNLNERGERGWTGSSYQPTCGALTAAEGEAELADWIQEVAECLAEGDTSEAWQLASGNPRVVAALGHNPIPLPEVG